MNKFLSPTVLSLLVGVSAIASVILCVMHVQYTRTIRTVHGTQQQFMLVQQRKAVMQQLANDLYAYSRTNAAIKPLLDSVAGKPSQP
jgi:hypothetical protein